MSLEEIEIADVIASLDGAVQSQGIPVGARAWLDMGSEEWGETDDKTRALAYTAAQVTGWKDESLRNLMVQSFAHLSHDMMDYTLGFLKELQEQHPVEVEDLGTKLEFTVEDKRS